MRPEPAQPEAQKTKTTRPIRRIEPNDETRPMTTPVRADEGSDMTAEDGQAQLLRVVVAGEGQRSRA